MKNFFFVFYLSSFYFILFYYFCFYLFLVINASQTAGGPVPTALNPAIVNDPNNAEINISHNHSVSLGSDELL